MSYRKLDEDLEDLETEEEDNLQSNLHQSYEHHESYIQNMVTEEGGRRPSSEKRNNVVVTEPEREQSAMSYSSRVS